MAKLNLIEEFKNEIKTVDFGALGIIDSNDNIHTLGTDSKIIGRVFEMLSQPILEKIAKKHNLILITPESQTVYPDFIMMKDEKDNEKIAIDIKTTYIESVDSQIKFTLGSFGSYLRNDTKNIEFPYTTFSKHYVIGFIYVRNDKAQQSKVFSFDERKKIEMPYKDVTVFIQEKYKIAGDKPGSGNTENIGSLSSSDIKNFINGNGPFSILGEDIFNAYWKYYPKYRSQQKIYTSLKEFIEWINNNHQDLELLNKKITYEEIKKAIDEYLKSFKS